MVITTRGWRVLESDHDSDIVVRAGHRCTVVVERHREALVISPRRPLERALRTAGSGVVLSLAALGAAAEPAALAGWIALGSIVGVGVAGASLQRPVPPGGRSPVSVGLRSCGLTVAACLALTGLVALVGSAAWPVAASAVLAAAAVWWAQAPHEVVVPDVAAERPPVPPQLPTGTLTTPELCLAWRRSYVVLLDTPAGPDHDGVVAMRRTLLDELERRDPAGFRRWIEAGARAAGDPARFLSPPIADG